MEIYDFINETQSHVLIVDDVPENIQILGNILAKKMNCSVSATIDSTEVLDIATESKPDLILLDINMPRLDGFELCKLLKNNIKTEEIPVIFISGKDETSDIVHGFKIGAVDYVTKPFNEEELLARVKTHLALKKSRDIQKRLINRLQDSLELVKLLANGEKAIERYTYHYKLTKKETLIFQEIFEGKATKEIAYDMGITAGTAKNHLLNIYKKVGVHSKVELITNYNKFFQS